MYLLLSRSKNTHFFYVDAKRLAAGYHRGHRGKEEIGNLGGGRE
jgi:hypothetical protein